MKKLWWICSLLCLSSCASLTFRGRHQDVLVDSYPPGAKIIDHGVEVGTTPQYVQIRKEDSPVIELLTAKEKHLVRLESNYDWREFSRNLCFLYGAPIGWLVDGITGADRKLSDPEKIQFQTRTAFAAEKPARLAIAPPLASSVTLSDAAAKILEEKMRVESRAQLTPYQQSLPVFVSHHFEFDDEPNRSDKYALFRELGITQILESKVLEDSTGDVLIQGQIIDVFSGKLISVQNIRIAQSSLQEMEVASWSRKTGWIHIIPNTLGIDLTTSQTEVDTSDGQNHLGQPAPGASGIEKAFYYLGALNITRLNAPRPVGTSRFRFQIIPNLFVLNQRFSFPDFTEISSTVFHYVQLSAGLGAEVGWQNGKHYIYFDLVPMYGLEYVSWQQDQQQKSLAVGGFDLRFEIGYRYFFDRHWSAKIFTKSTSSETSLWDSVVHDIAPGASAVSTSVTNSGGIEISYTFDFSPDIHIVEK